ncbi:MAG TPA: hypothetical protein P5277_02445 [Candidatus Paceibacterota bacterium]|nr:hypothetical protein [Candidatus Paceibacterota bacterium]
MINNSNVSILAQYINTLSEACQELENSYMNKDLKKFEKSKKLIIELKDKINFILQ